MRYFFLQIWRSVKYEYAYYVVLCLGVCVIGLYFSKALSNFLGNLTPFSIFELAIAIFFSTLGFSHVRKKILYDLQFLHDIVPIRQYRAIKTSRLVMLNIFWLPFLLFNFYFVLEIKQHLFFIAFVVINNLILIFDSDLKRKSRVLQINFSNKIKLDVLMKINLSKIYDLDKSVFLLYVLLFTPLLILVPTLFNLSRQFFEAYMTLPLLVMVNLFFLYIIATDRDDSPFLADQNNNYKAQIANSESTLACFVIFFVSLVLSIFIILNENTILFNELLSTMIVILICKPYLFTASYFREMSRGRPVFRILLSIINYLPPVFFWIYFSKRNLCYERKP